MNQMHRIAHTIMVCAEFPSREGISRVVGAFVRNRHAERERARMALAYARFLFPKEQS